MWTSLLDCDMSDAVAMVPAERGSVLQVEVHNEQGLVASGNVPIANLWQVGLCPTMLRCRCGLCVHTVILAVSNQISPVRQVHALAVVHRHAAYITQASAEAERRTPIC